MIKAMSQKIFTSKERNNRIEAYFKREFDIIDNIDKDTVIANIKKCI